MTYPVKSLSPMQATKRVRVLIADDHPVVRFGLKSMLDLHPRIEVVGEAATGTETLEVAERTLPDLVLLDLRMPDPDGIKVCAILKSRTPAPAVLFLTSYADHKTVLEATQSGADGYLLKTLSDEDIPSAILAVADGGSVLDPIAGRAVLDSLKPRQTASATPPRQTDREALSRMEQRVLDLVGQGKANKEIAALLRLSDGTVRNYLSTIYAKLCVENRVEAAIVALKGLR